MRKILFYCCLAVIAAMCIFPPWKETRLNYNKIKVDVPAGYSPIWFPPNFEIAEKTYNAFDIAEKIYASEKPLVSLPEGFELVKSPEMNDAGKRVRTVAAYSIDFDRLALQMIPVIMLAAILRFYARII